MMEVHFNCKVFSLINNSYDVILFPYNLPNPNMNIDKSRTYFENKLIIMTMSKKKKAIEKIVRENLVNVYFTIILLAFLFFLNGFLIVFLPVTI